MSTLRDEYDKIVSEMADITKQLKKLSKSEMVKKYLELKSQYDQLSCMQQDLYNKIKDNEYSSCNHIWISSLVNGKYRYFGCIKCGLDQRILGLDVPPSALFFDQQKMYEFMKKHPSYRQGIYTKISCNLNLARAIYSKIKEAHPDIDDETAAKYFEVALTNIRNTEVSDKRQENRAKRLSLSPKFNSWNASDVHKF